MSPCREWIIQVKSKEAAAWIISFSLSSSLLSFFQCTPHCAKKRPVLKEKRPLRIRSKKRPHEAPVPCDGAAAVLAESKDRGPLKESLEELKPSVQLVPNQEDLREAQKAVQTAHRRHSRQQKLREGILWSVILEKNGRIDRTFAFADGTAALLQPRFPVTLMGPCPFLERNVPMKDVIFFDLDGTLTKSEEGIIRCVQYALRELGMPVPAKRTFLFHRTAPCRFFPDPSWVYRSHGP